METAEKKISNLLFIDRNNYDNILDKKFNIADLIDVVYGDKVNERISVLTNNIIIETNDRLLKALFDYGFYNPNKFRLSNSLNDADAKYVSHYVEKVLTERTEDFSVEKKYYELIPLINNDILVVFEEAFFEIITESKEKLERFVLDCLCYQYKFNSDMGLLMKLYITLQINETALNMVKLRFN